MGLVRGRSGAGRGASSRISKGAGGGGDGVEDCVVDCWLESGMLRGSKPLNCEGWYSVAFESEGDGSGKVTPPVQASRRRINVLSPSFHCISERRRRRRLRFRADMVAAMESGLSNL